MHYVLGVDNNRISIVPYGFSTETAVWAYIVYRFRDGRGFPSKNAIFHTSVFNTPTEGFVFEFCSGVCIRKWN